MLLDLRFSEWKTEPISMIFSITKEIVMELQENVICFF